MQSKVSSTILLAMSTLIFAPVTQAHTGPAESGMLAGFLHPASGLDHLLAALAVGLWAAHSGKQAGRGLVATFLVMLLLGAVAGLAGLRLPGAEAAAALSVLLVGLAIAMAVRLPQLAAYLITGGFASIHGYLHVMALPPLTGAAGYLFGFLLMTALLLGSGIVLHHLLRFERTGFLYRSCGFLLAFTGSTLLVSV